MGNCAAVPQSELGRCTGISGLGAVPLMVMRCYLDGSESHESREHKWLTLVGYLANDAFWARFDAEWKQMLHERYPIAPYIHMRELVNHEDPFDAGWTSDKVNALVNDALQLLSRIGAREYLSVVISIDLTAHKALVDRGSKISEPFQLCANLCIGKAFSWYFESKVDSLEPAYVFFDRGEQYYPVFQRQWLACRTPPRHIVKVNPFWDWIANVEEVDMATTPAIQACDMLAWGTTRSLLKRVRPFRDLARMIGQLVPTWKLVLDEDILQQKHSPGGSVAL